MSTYKRINYLMQRCLDQVETEEERAELESYYKNSRFNILIQQALISSFQQEKVLVDMDQEKQEQILNAIKTIDASPLHQPVRRIAYLKWASIAAVLILMLSPFIMEMGKFEIPEFAWKEADRSRTLDSVIVPVNSLTFDQLPAKDMAILEMADGKSFELEKLKAGTQILFEGLVMERTAEGFLHVRFDKQALDKPQIRQCYHTISTPRAGTQTIILADGTKVQLNAASKLSFPNAFDKEERRVVLEGEGYFDVAKDVGKRFIVRSGHENTLQEVLVYGTSFNISAYPEDKEIKTTLVEGSIKIKGLKAAVETFIKPNELATISEAGLHIANADLESSLAWKNDMFYFHNESLENVMKQLSRWYDVDVNYLGHTTESRFWGQISRRKNLTEILNMLSKTNQLKFTIKGKEVTVMN